MISILALQMGGPLMLMFGLLTAAVVGAAGGYVMGTNIGRTSPGTPLATSLRLTRERLASATANLERASGAYNERNESAAAGSAIVLGRRVEELSTDLGRLERKAQHRRGEGA